MKSSGTSAVLEQGLYRNKCSFGTRAVSGQGMVRNMCSFGTKDDKEQEQFRDKCSFGTSNEMEQGMREKELRGTRNESTRAVPKQAMNRNKKCATTSE